MEESSGLTPTAWHTRYQLQAGWTASIRNYLYQRASLQDARRILEVGCGSGVICRSLHQNRQSQVVGVDIDRTILAIARDYDNAAGFINGDGYHLPIADAVFDVVLCHYLLLWLTSPVAVLKEMARVCRRGGYILALAEPDYAGRIDHPGELVELGKLQTEGLKSQGVNTRAGRQLAQWCHQARLESIESGVLGGQWKEQPSDALLTSEWELLKYDLAGLLDTDQIARFRQIDRSAWTAGQRVLYVPTFYAAGRVK
jgi:ubiquinone/menaquinone biosynthesis C-methylase UbiE